MKWLWSLLRFGKLVDEALDARMIDLVKRYCTELDPDKFYLLVLPGDFTNQEADRVRIHLNQHDINCMVIAGADHFRLIEMGD